MTTVDFLGLLAMLLVAGALGFALGREFGIAKGWRDAQELYGTDDTDEAGA